MPIVLNGDTGIQNASWTTAGRPTSPAVGQQGYNTSLSAFEYWNGTTWQPVFSNLAILVDYLVVAGGGGGGRNLNSGDGGAGGGGAGGYREAAGSAINFGNTYTVTVGAGGAGGAAGAKGTNGSNSVFASITSIGGGGGGYTLAAS